MFELIFFGMYAFVLIAAAIGVVASRNPVHSAMFLVLAFFSSAVLWLLLEAEFLAMTLVLVYVGAVMVLFLFVVMMLDINIARLREGFVRYLPLGIAVAVIMFVMMISVITGGIFSGDNAVEPIARAADYSNTKALGRVLYTEYVLAFEIAAVILLVAIVAAISLTMRKRTHTKYQNPSAQIRATKADRLRIVKMASSSEPAGSESVSNKSLGNE
jgi:NADH-quinone oxidoreductase subunit J